MVQSVDDASFGAEVLNIPDRPVLVDFWAPWCGPCRMVSPVVEEMEQKFGERLKVVKLNTDENSSTSMKYQISGIPCLIIFKNGEEINRLVGYRPAEMLSQDIEKSLG